MGKKAISEKGSIRKPSKKKKQRYTAAEKEQVIQKMMSCINIMTNKPFWTKIAEETGINTSTLCRWWQDVEEQSANIETSESIDNTNNSGNGGGGEGINLQAEREKCKKKFVEDAWSGIQKAQKLINAELDKMIEEGKARNLGQLVTYMGVSFDKLQLMQGQPTSITALAETIAQTVSEDEQEKLLKEAAGIEGVVKFPNKK